MNLFMQVWWLLMFLIPGLKICEILKLTKGMQYIKDTSTRGFT